MKTYTCVIVDDEELARELLQNHASQIDSLEVIASCGSAIEANRVIKENHVDLLLLDIELPVLKGTDFLKTLRHKPHVIFTTAYRDYALDGFDLNAVDYLLKPITFQRFFQAINKFLSLQPQEPVIQPPKDAVSHLFIKEKRKQVKLPLDQITYLRSLKDYVEIHLATQKKHLVKATLTATLDKLGPSFERVHRSYAVNLAQITAFTSHDLEIGSIEIPLGDQYKTAVLEILKTQSLDL